MPDLKTDMCRAQQVAYEAYLATGSLLALTDCNHPDKLLFARELDKLAGRFESGAMEIRSLCETHRPNLHDRIKKPLISPFTLTGEVSVNEYGWVHITLHTLLPHCRFQTPAFLIDTITRLLDEYESKSQKLPRFDRAMLIVDEHCDVESRQVYDQDNKGWKAIPNAIKGRLIEDDDQFSLQVALLSTKDTVPSCHIYLIHPDDTGDFFSLRTGQFPHLFL